jgi:hypothetical protein
VRAGDGARTHDPQLGKPRRRASESSLAPPTSAARSDAIRLRLQSQQSGEPLADMLHRSRDLVVGERALHLYGRLRHHLRAGSSSELVGTALHETTNRSCTATGTPPATTRVFGSPAGRVRLDRMAGGHDIALGRLARRGVTGVRPGTSSRMTSQGDSPRAPFPSRFAPDAVVTTTPADGSSARPATSRLSSL